MDWKCKQKEGWNLLGNYYIGSIYRVTRGCQQAQEMMQEEIKLTSIHSSTKE
jgi:hypothetical protein